MSYIGRISTPKSRKTTPNDVIMTKPETAKWIIDYFKPTGTILEPCKGDGAFYNQFEGDKDWCEIREGKDFFDYNLTDTVYFVGVFIIVMFILSNASNAYVLWKTLKFSANQSHKISCRVMKKYLEQPYKYFVDSDFSVIKKNILREASLFSDGFLLPVLQIISKTFILIALSLYA